jgi:CubicO group peptidase (beta-lactamase class C family)
MCLTHTTGFPNWRFLEPDKKLKIKSYPGTRYRYSGEGIYLLQFVLEQIIGKNLETIAQERVFEPLQLFWDSLVPFLPSLTQDQAMIPINQSRFDSLLSVNSLSVQVL